MTRPTEPLGKLTHITTGKLDSNAALVNGKYPYFTCSPQTLAIDEYAFDCEAVLLAGNNANGVFSVKRYAGRFNAYQRTYVITARDKARLNIDYLYYFLQTLGAHLTAMSNGTATKFLTRTILDPLAVPMPTPSEQAAIASTLKILDDKIELNRRMNETLEAMARAIFKDWFVDFGPTRAKIEGRAPYLAADIWSLFPDRLDDEGKPEGWNEEPFTRFTDIISGGTPKTDIPDYWGGHIPWFSVVDTPSGSDVFVRTTEKTITVKGLDESAARLVAAGTTIISARGTVGNLAIAAREMTFNQSCYGLRAKAPVGDCFVYLAAERLVEKLKAMSHGSVFSTITRQTFDGVNFLRSSPEVLRGFEHAVGASFEKLKSNGDENQTLAALRDLLLPKLMSGEIRINDAEKLVGEAV